MTTGTKTKSPHCPSFATAHHHWPDSCIVLCMHSRILVLHKCLCEILLQ